MSVNAAIAAFERTVTDFWPSFERALVLSAERLSSELRHANHAVDYCMQRLTETQALLDAVRQHIASVDQWENEGGRTVW